MTVPLFGVIVLAAVAITASALALPLALGASYAAAAALFARYSTGKRLLAQGGVFLAALIGFVVAGVVVLFAGMSGHAGSGVKVWGLELFEPVLIGAPLAASPFVVVAGELLVWVRRSGAPPSEAQAGQRRNG